MKSVCACVCVRIPVWNQCQSRSRVKRNKNSMPCNGYRQHRQVLIIYRALEHSTLSLNGWALFNEQKMLHAMYIKETVK